MKKNLLLALSFLLLAVGMQAKTWTADVSKIASNSGNATYDSETCVMTWTAAWSNSVKIAEFSGDLSAYTTFNFTVSCTPGDGGYGYRVLVYVNGDSSARITQLGTDGTRNLTWETLGVSDSDLKNINYICFAGWGSAGTLEISDVYLEGPDISYIEASVPSTELTKSMFQTWDSSAADATSTGATPWWSATDAGTETSAGGVIFGNSNVNYLEYADLTEYSKMIIYGSGSSLRVMFNRLTDGGATTEVNPVPSQSGTEVDLTSYEFTHLNCIKVGWGGTATVDKIELISKTPSDISYILKGEVVGSESLTAALADASATVIDATGLTNTTPIELTSANPNCVFIANAGALSNSKNVLIDETFENLELTDGYDFVLPEQHATVASASYSRTMPNTFGTICIPLPIAEPTDGTKYYSINCIDDEGTLMLTEITSYPIAPATPVIVFNENKSLAIECSECSVLGGITAEISKDQNSTLTGLFQTKVIDVTADDDNYYGISNNQFVKANKSLTVKPFRAYITTSGNAASKLRIDIAGGEASAISALTSAANTVAGIYGANGTRQNSLTKGLNIVKMSDGSVQKIMVK